jgi:hypothetical protein
VPHIILKRSDIPAGTLQVVDLDPNTSQRNLTLDPPGQTKYIDPVQNDAIAVQNVAGVITTIAEYNGLTAWFLTNLDDGGGASLTVAEATTNATNVLNLLAFGDLTTAAGALTVAAINGTGGFTGTVVAGQLQALLDVLAGQTYTVPAGVQVEAAGAFNVQPAIGADGGPFYGDIRRIYDTSSLLLSVNTGELQGFLDTGFEYRGVGGAQGEAVAVYNDDGTLF